jgi:hypothetical protein
MKIDVYYEIVTEESAAEGDAAERGHEETLEFDDLGEVLDYLDRHGPYEASSSEFDSRVWYNGPVIEDRAFFEKGEHRSLSYHLKDMTDAQKEVVFKVLTQNYKPTVNDLLGTEAVLNAVERFALAIGVFQNHENEELARRVSEFSSTFRSTLDGDKLLIQVSNVQLAINSVYEDVEPTRLPEEYRTAADAIYGLIDRAEELGFDIESQTDPMPEQDSGFRR